MNPINTTNCPFNPTPRAPQQQTPHPPLTLHHANIEMTHRDLLTWTAAPDTGSKKYKISTFVYVLVSEIFLNLIFKTISNSADFVESRKRSHKRISESC
jgi:hypothetical protein